MNSGKIENNCVHLCESCMRVYAECSATQDDILFGDGFTGDNICCCNKYEPKTAQNEILDPIPQWGWSCSKHERPAVLYGIEDSMTGRIIFRSDGGCYRCYSNASKWQRKLGVERYRVVEYRLVEG